MTTSLTSRLCAKQPILILPEIHDGLTAALAQEAGAEACYLSSAAMAAAQFGRPDFEAVSMSDVANAISVIRDLIDLPLVVDAENGFGTALNVHRTVRAFERMGADAIQIEDQILPKPCGHLSATALVTQTEMVGKISAALDARRSDRTMIIARTDAINVVGLTRTIERIEAYAAAGAEAVYVRAIPTAQSARDIATALPDVTLIADICDTGPSRPRSADHLHDSGYAAVIFPDGIVRVQALSAYQYYASLLEQQGLDGLPVALMDPAKLSLSLREADIQILGRRFNGINAKPRPGVG